MNCYKTELERKTKTEERFWSRVEIPFDKQACWLWKGYILDGYGKFSLTTQDRKEKNVSAHKFAYELLVGTVPKGLTLDHLCRIRNCVNPAHLEPVTNKENVLRGIGISAQNAKKTHCKRGHEFTNDNTHIKHGKYGTVRSCIICRKFLDIRAARRKGIKPKFGRTHCPQGHEYNKENTRFLQNGSRKGKRYCIQCCRTRDKLRKFKEK